MNPNRTRTRKTRFDSGSSTKLGIASCCRFMLSLREYQKRSVVVKAVPITSLVQLCKFGGIKTPKICVQNKPTFLTYFVFLIFCRLDQKIQPAGSVPLKRLNRSARSVRKTLDRFQIWPEALKKITESRTRNRTIPDSRGLWPEPLKKEVTGIKPEPGLKKLGPAHVQYRHFYN
jgi:hypothetical protein